MDVQLTPRGTRGAEMPALARLLIPALSGLGIAAYRLIGGRMRLMGQPLLLLTTVGARTGKTRRTLLVCFPEGKEAWLIVASFGGMARHPAWYVNMARNPDKVGIEIRGRRFPVRPASLRGPEREEAWQRIVSLAPGYGAYQQKTDREIPVVRLTNVE